MAINRLPLSPVYRIKADMDIDIKKETLLMIDKGHFAYSQGTLLVLTRDDGTWAPEFKPQGAPDNVYEYINMNRLAIFDPTDPDHTALAAKAKLRGLFTNRASQTRSPEESDQEVAKPHRLK